MRISPSKIVSSEIPNCPLFVLISRCILAYFAVSLPLSNIFWEGLQALPKNQGIANRNGPETYILFYCNAFLNKSRASRDIFVLSRTLASFSLLQRGQYAVLIGVRRFKIY